MRYCYISLCVLFLIFSSVYMSFAITLDMLASDRSNLPEGPSPKNYPQDSKGNKYDPSTAQTFSFQIKGLDDHALYKISVILTRSDYDGFAVNFPQNGTNKYKDLKFLKSDYVQTVNKQKTYPLGWRYKNDKSLHFNNENLHYELPKNIVVRCFDWGANGTLTVTIKKKIGNRWVSSGIPLTHRIPFDEDENGIADSWETEASLKVTRPNGKKGYDPDVDNEIIETLLGKAYPDGWPGDGWTIGDEYRGAFLEITDAEVTRLNPMRKEVIVSPEDTDDPKDMWSYGTGSYSVPEHDLLLMHPTFVKKPFDNYKGLFGVKKDVGQVNFNSDRKRVYAIRVEAGGIHEDGYNVGGTSPLGSPAPESKVIIYVRGITEIIRLGGKGRALTESQRQDAIDVMIGTTISHEIGHSLDADHCIDKTCLMYKNPDRHSKTSNYEWTPLNRLRSKRDGFKRHRVNEHYYAVTGSAIAKWVNTYIYIDVVLDEVGTVPSTTPSTTPTTTTPTTTPTLSFSFAPSDGLYTAVAGDLHTAQVSASEEIFGVTWYVASPGDTGRGSHVNVGSGIGDGDATTASLDYTFPSGVSGDYVFTALVYKNSDLSLMGEVSYTVSVSLPGSTPPTVSLPVWSDIPDPYNLTVGDSFTLDLSSYVSGSPTLTRTAGWIPAGLRFSSGILSGTVTTVESRSLQFEATNSAGLLRANGFSSELVLQHLLSSGRLFL